jgi:hypothetical protein
MKPQLQSLSQRSIVLRALNALLQPRTWGRILFVLTCLATLVIAFYLFEKWRGVSAWHRYEQEQSARGVKLDFAQFIPPTVPDEENFAMTPALAVIFDFVPGTREPRDTNALARTREVGGRGNFDLPVLKPGERFDFAQWLAKSPEVVGGSRFETGPNLSAEQAAQALLAALQTAEPMFQELAEASRRPHTRFPLAYDGLVPEILLPHLSVMSRVCKVLYFHGVAALATGQPEIAFRNAQLQWALAASLKREPFLISGLVRVACLRAFALLAQEGILGGSWSEPQLRAFEQQLATIDFLTDTRWLFEAERAGASRLIEQLRERHERFAQIVEDPIARLVVRWVPQGWFYLERVQYNRAFDSFILPVVDPTRRRFDPALAAAKDQALGEFLSESPFRHHRLLCRMLLPALGSASKKMAHVQTTLDLLRVACAAERYHRTTQRWPAQLADLTATVQDPLPHDVITGEPLRYQATPSGFLVYSVGWNMTDDGGVVGLDKRGRPDPNQGDWIWRR